MTVREITTGQDSFLDIVANLVGVLIILIVIVGAHAASSWDEVIVNEDLTAEINSASQEVERTSVTATNLHYDNQTLERKAHNEMVLAAAASERRHQTLVNLEVVRQGLEAERAKLNEQQQQQLERASQLASLQSNLDEINRETKAITASHRKSAVKTIEHHPNPISQTVFTDIIYFQLLNNRLAYIPVDPLVEQMRSQWRVKGQELQRGTQTIQTVGPVGLFRLQYTLERHVDRIGLAGYEVLGVSDMIGEPIEQALQPGSRFREVISMHNPGKTTITIGAYPQSLDSHRQVKTWLHQQGYKVASRVIPVGGHLSWGHDGSHVNAQ